MTIPWKTAVSFQLSMDRELIQRKAYNLLDYLRDIGGLLGAISGLCMTIMIALNFDGYYHLLTSKLYKLKTDGQRNE